MSSCSGVVDFTGIFPYLIDILDIALTIVGLIPAPVPIAGQAGMVADIVTIGLNALSQDSIGMVLSTISVIPIAGEFSGTIKIIYKVVRILERIMASPMIKIVVALGTLGLIGFVYYFIFFI